MKQTTCRVSHLVTHVGGIPDRVPTLNSPIPLTPEAADAAVRTVKLAELAEGQAPTVGTLQNRAADGTSLIGLAELPPDEWLDLAYRHGTPADESRKRTRPECRLRSNRIAGMEPAYFTSAVAGAIEREMTVHERLDRRFPTTSREK